MNCEYCGAEIKCGHEREISRLKAAVKEARYYVECLTWMEGAKNWIAKYGQARPQYDPEEDSFE